VTNVIRNNAGSAAEPSPALAISPAMVTLLRSGQITAWWSASGMIEGLAPGSTLPVKWKHWLDGAKFANSLRLSASKKPILAYDQAVGRYYAQLGYGGALTRRTLNLADLFVVTGGSGYVANELVTLSNGVVVKFTGSSGVFSTDSNFTIQNYGSFSSAPTGPLAQVSTTGSGSGATFLPSMKTDCGAMDLIPTAAMIPDTLFSIIAVFRCPTIEAQPDSGGFIFGSQLNESELFSTSNNRYLGLRVGNQSSGEGVLNFHHKGDGARTSVGGDKRDGMWHVAVGCIPAAGSSVRLWVDGVLNDNIVGGNFASLNTTNGVKYLRAGAAGKPATGPTGGFCGDIAELLIVPVDLNATANAALRVQITQALLDMYRPGLIAG